MRWSGGRGGGGEGFVDLVAFEEKDGRVLLDSNDLILMLLLLFYFLIF